MRSFLSRTGKTFFLIAACCLYIDGSVSICLGADAQAKDTSSKNLVIEVRQLALMPFLKGDTQTQKKEKQLEKNLDCQLRGLCAIEEDVFSGAEETVTIQAQSELRKKFGDKVLPMAMVTSDYSAIKKEPTDTPREIAVRLGQSLGVDHVMVGLVWRFQERVGGAMGASEPASVAFSLFMVNVASQKVVWKGSYDKTQTSLSENLFDAPMFLKKGMKWLTAEELSSYGIQKVLGKLFIKQ